MKPPPLGADVIQVLERWRPTKWSQSDLRILEPLMPTIRGWVERMDLPDADHTRNFLLAASAIAVWALRSFGNADPTVVFHPSNVEAWSMTVRANKSLRWRQTTRSRLRALGRVINAEGWPPPTQQVSKHAVARPYAIVDERVFRLVYGLPGPANRSQRLWIVSASLGAGLRGNAIAAAHTSDIENIGDGRLAVRVRGNNLDWCQSEPTTPTSPEQPPTHPPQIGLYRRMLATSCTTPSQNSNPACHCRGPVQRGYWLTCWQEHPWPCCG